MLFSCLVDADFLDTETHFEPSLTAARRAPNVSLSDLAHRLDRAQAVLEAAAPTTPVNIARAEIARASVASAPADTGLFRLAVPTGGGKTRAGMAFALEHARHHGLARVVVAVPFTSITEQTADVYRQIFGPECVLEHHSAVDERRLDSFGPRTRLWARLATENWDAPIVVTTTVQLFESLFANSPSATRKLHRLARAVILIDEAQAIPPTVVAPVVASLRLLAEEYGSTVILSTATQPAADVPQLNWLNQARDIVPSPERFFAQLKRVNWEIVRDVWEPARISQQMDALPQVLAIVNTRREAVRVLSQGDRSMLHLSTLLCGAHRRAALAEVRRRLAAGESCRLLSTQVVEAGVDIDFPVVLRELAPLDSMVQAAGRCNREGRLHHGRVIVFEGTTPPPRGAYRTGTQITRALLAEGYGDFEAPGTAASYFRDLYRDVNLDIHNVQEAQRRLAFQQVAQRFRLIEDEGSPVVVRYDASVDGLLDELRRSRAESNPGRARFLLRRLQPYTVSLRQNELDRARRSGWVSDDLIPIWTGPYDKVRGVGAVLLAEEGEE